MIISLENISKNYNGECVLKNVALTIEDGDRIGLTGINGCGKSTLLRIIAGTEIPDSAPEPNPPRISSNKNKNIGFLAQDSGLNGKITIIEEMKSVFSELHRIAERLDELRSNALMLQEPQFAEEYSTKTAYFESNDGYLTDIKINKVLNGMGFPPPLYSRVISTLSGGERTRLALAKLLLENPDLLILDEPTNHLDFDTVLWLEDYLKDYKGALLIVSHDRYFLDKLSTSICEIERGRLMRFKGNYTAFTSQKNEYIEYQMKEYKSQIAEISKLKDYVARNIVRASTSNMAKSRAKQLEKLEADLTEKPIINQKSAKIKFEYDREPPKDVLSVKGIDLTVGEGRVLLDSLTFDVRRGERLAVVGANGSGKSTLLKALQKLHPHSRGNIEWGENIKISYFEQTNTAIFDADDTVLNAVHKLYPQMRELAVRSLLGSVRLTGDDVYKKVEALSGGERAKLRFAVMSLERGNVLILDEPTNHLDITTRDVLETALFDYSGTIIFVSHDRYLLNKLATRIIELTPNCVYSYNGGFGEFIEEKQRRNDIARQAESVSITPETKKNNLKTSYRSKEQRAVEAQKRVRIKKLETEIEKLETIITNLQTEMEDPQVFSDHNLLQEKCTFFEESKHKLSELTDEWLLLSEDF
ncbi:MAG: ABC-F family ATP-binding cassette domain-containing protein [Oscillospiraceae bacterium]|nr:ABC-F family ATP-binding cassette domain-containing protein [Oscillospiraceae bacterium]